jgi:NADH-quinone oxidoreductase subunit H
MTGGENRTLPPISHELALFVQTWWLELVCALTILFLTPLFSAYLLAFESSVAARSIFSLKIPAAEKPQQTEASDNSAEVSPGLLATPPSPLHPLFSLFHALKTPAPVPADADPFLFQFAPLASLSIAMLSLGALAYGPQFQVARDLNIGIPFIFLSAALAAVSILIRVSSPERQSPASLVAILQPAAQFSSFQICAFLALLSALILTGTFEIPSVIEAQSQLGVWSAFLIPIAFVLYFSATLGAALPLAPPDPNPPHQDFRWAVDSIAQYAAIFAASALATTVFLGGWLRPFAAIHAMNWLDWFPAATLAAIAGLAAWQAGNRKHLAHAATFWLAAFVTLAIAVPLVAVLLYEPLRPMQPAIHGAFWFLAKTISYLIVFLWFRAISPRFRFHQYLRAAWNFLLPVAAVQFLATAASLVLRGQFGWNRWLAFTPGFCVTLAFAALLVVANGRRSVDISFAPAAAAEGAHSDAQ